MVKTKPNIAFAISVTSYFTKNLGHKYTETVKNSFVIFKALK